MTDEEWKPPTRRLGDAVMFYDWQPIRRAIDAAGTALDRDYSGGVPAEDWNLVGLAISAFAHQSRERCLDCRKALWPREVIRCLDCKTPLCEGCAPRHFWPNGRPAKGGHGH